MHSVIDCQAIKHTVNCKMSSNQWVNIVFWSSLWAYHVLYQWILYVLSWRIVNVLARMFLSYFWLRFLATQEINTTTPSRVQKQFANLVYTLLFLSYELTLLTLIHPSRLHRDTWLHCKRVVYRKQRPLRSIKPLYVYYSWWVLGLTAP